MVSFKLRNKIVIDNIPVYIATDNNYQSYKNAQTPREKREVIRMGLLYGGIEKIENGETNEKAN